MHKGSGAVIAETQYAVSDATRGLAKLDLREQELKDMEVARRIQEEDMKVRRGVMSWQTKKLFSPTNLPLDEQDLTHFDSL